MCKLATSSNSPGRRRKKPPFDLHAFLMALELAAFHIAVTASFLYALYLTLKHEIGW